MLCRSCELPTCLACNVLALLGLLWQHSDRALIFILFLLYGAATVSFTTFVRTPTVAVKTGERGSVVFDTEVIVCVSCTLSMILDCAAS